MIAYFVTPEEVRGLSRKISSLINDDKIKILIDEVQESHVKSSIGEDLYIDISEYILSENADEISHYETLLNGGVYIYDDCGKTRKSSFKGLKTAISYIVNSKMSKSNDVNITRFGVRSKNDQYSKSVSKDDILDYEGDIRRVGEEYLKDCILYVKREKEFDKICGRELWFPSDEEVYIVGR